MRKQKSQKWRVVAGKVDLWFLITKKAIVTAIRHPIRRFLSHPLVVCLIGGMGVCSLAVHPDPIFCRDEP